jgi:predicted PurR-regulated permease PerM
MSLEPQRESRPAPPIGLIMLGIAAVTVIAMAGIQTISSIVAPAFFGLTMVVTARPLIVWLRRYLHLPGWLATLITLLVVYIVLLAILGGIIYGVSETGRLLPQYTSNFQQIYNDVLVWLSGLGVDVTNYEQYLAQIDFNQIIGAVGQIANALTSTTSQAILFVVVTAFMGFDTISVKGRTESLREAAPYLTDALTGFATQVRKYWVVSTVFGAIVAVFDGIALMWMGVPLPWTFALFAFVTNYIPNIGFVIGLIPPALIALLDGGVSTMIWVIVVYIIINNGFQTFIQPKVTGDAVGLNSTITFISLVFWTAIVGPMGAILAVPLTLFAKAVLIDSDPRTKVFAVFMQAGDKKVTGTQAEIEASARLRAERRGRNASGAQEGAEAEPARTGRKGSEITVGELRRARASSPDAAAEQGAPRQDARGGASQGEARPAEGPQGEAPQREAPRPTTGAHPIRPSAPRPTTGGTDYAAGGPTRENPQRGREADGESGPPPTYPPTAPDSDTSGS